MKSVFFVDPFHVKHHLILDFHEEKNFLSSIWVDVFMIHGIEKSFQESKQNPRQ